MYSSIYCPISAASILDCQCNEDFCAILCSVYCSQAYQGNRIAFKYSPNSTPQPSNSIPQPSNTMVFLDKYANSYKYTHIAKTIIFTTY